ncbi:hypothetical protein EV401DRAFT_1911994, partial [Pisolithus croceorrhizus]
MGIVFLVVLMKLAFRTAGKRAGKALFAAVAPGMQLISTIFMACMVVRTACEVVRTACEIVRTACDTVRTTCDAAHTACAIVNSRKPGASNNATATLSQTQATAYLPAEPLRFFDMQGTPPHFHQPATLPVVDNAGHVCYC